MQKCRRCLEAIPEARLKALPGTKECVECSSVEMNVVRTVITGKTTYSEVEVIKNDDTKKYLKRLEGKGRTGFGSMLYRGSSKEPARKVKLGTRAARPGILFTREAFDQALQEAMSWVDYDIDRALRTVDNRFNEEMIDGAQRRQIRDIIEVFKLQGESV